MPFFRTPRLLCALLAAFLWLGGCAQRPVIPPTPGPVPVPTPTPTPAPTGHVVTEAEFEAVALGSPEADLARFGEPIRRVPLPAEGVTVVVYRATTAADPTRTAEFWTRNGVVVNKVLY